MVAVTMGERRLPDGLTPRLLSRDAAATYCGISPTLFDEHVVPAVPALRIGARTLWDIKKLDRWLDEQSGFAHAGPGRSLGERLNGEPRR
jgi:hypothetical protein